MQALEGRTLLSAFMVSNTTDADPGSLRQAILDANAAGGGTIDFVLTGTGPFLIQPASPLPTITAPILIDGYSQLGASANTLTKGDNATILVQLDGSNIPYADGLAISGGNSTVQGLDITRFSIGVHLTGSGADVVAGDFIGVDPTGGFAEGNANFGVFVDSSAGNTVGGTAPAARDVVSGNGAIQVLIGNQGASGNLVQGSIIGPDRSGKAAISNFSQAGVALAYAPGNTVGGTVAGAGDLISGNPGNGITIAGYGSSGNVVQGNLIGTDVNGTGVLGNGTGIYVDSGSTGGQIGGTAPGSGNVISANGVGVNLGGSNFQLLGNFIGTDATGLAALGNSGQGILIPYSANDAIGGTAPGSGNVISANGLAGIELRQGTNDLIQGNRIGTDAGGTSALGNGGDGVLIGFTRDGTLYSSGPTGNTVGGQGAGAGNIIAGNGGNGVTVGAFPADPATANSILSNSIFANAKLGIDLGDDGVTPNSPGGANTGPNLLQNYPVLVASAKFGATTVIKGTLNAAPSTSFTVQFFANPTPDPSGYGEGKTYLGQATVTTDSTGNASFQASLPVAVPTGQFVSATATDPAGNTSEFSADVQVVKATSSIYAANDAYSTDVNTTLLVAAPGVLANDISVIKGAVDPVVVQGPAHGVVTLNPDGSFTYSPSAGFVGLDTFTYKDLVGSRSSNVATVTIEVNPKTLTVTNVNDSGPGSLRQAILTADGSNSPGVETILFHIPGAGPFTISPSTALPTLTHPTTIDGYSQPGAYANTLALGDNATILVRLDGSATNGVDGLTLAAGGSTVRGLAITRFVNGVVLKGAGGDAVSGDFLGTDPTGLAPSLGNQVGLLVVDAGGDMIGGTSPGARDIISGNVQQGVQIDNVSGNDRVQGDYIGTTLTGGAALPNGTGVNLISAPNALIGGTAAGAGNVISGNRGSGISVGGPPNGSPVVSGTTIQGNYIGTDATGSIPLGNTFGIYLITGDSILVGGTAAAARNIISGNVDGIRTGSTGVTIQGNYIGTDARGARSLGNSTDGIILQGATIIGGATAGAGNLISGNGSDGIDSPNAVGGPSPFPGIAIQGNLIGTDATGTLAIGNGRDGLELSADNDTIGGTSRAARNVISGNGRAGLELNGFGNLVEGNLIGTDVTGNLPLGNARDGIRIDIGSSNTIGGTAPGAGNIIAHNGGNGVNVAGSPFDTVVGNAILSNSIFDNAKLGIDLGDDGVTPNTPGGANAGPNLLQNYPVLVAAASYNGQTVIKGTLNAAPSTSFTVQFFANPTPDPSGYGEGKTYLGQTTVATDANGNASFQVRFATPSGRDITATATDPAGDTSEFSADIPLVATAQGLFAQNDAYATSPGVELYVPSPGVLANDINLGGGTFTAMLVHGPAHGQALVAANGSIFYVPNAGFKGTDSFTYKDVQGSRSSNVATVTITVALKPLVVTNTNDSGPGSLRQAILDANAVAGAAPDTISFDIPGNGPFTISPSSTLPTLTHPTVIDGYSQPGAGANTLDQGDNATILIDLDGSNVAFASGLMISSQGVVVRGLAFTNFGINVFVLGGGSDTIAGDFLGLDPSGYAAGSSGDGVRIDSSPAVTIGGTSPADRDIIANSGGPGIELYNPGASGAVIQGDYIGTDPSGTVAMGNATGIRADDASALVIGGTSPGSRNLISGNYGDGIDLFQTTVVRAGQAQIRGNTIGTDVTGTMALGNSGYGVLLNNSNGDVIGGTAPGAGNLISANGIIGLAIDSNSSFNVVQGNRIGTDASGTFALGNVSGGIALGETSASPSFRNTIGGTAPGAGNLISGNGQAGISIVGQGYFSGPTPEYDVVQGNRIGTDITGTQALGNLGDGVRIIYGASNISIGGTAAGAANIIAFNGGNGVTVGITSSDVAVDVAILSNSIFANAKLGIDLGNDGVTPNFTSPPNQGPNNFQEYPVLISAITSGTSTTISGTLNGTPGNTFTVQFFSDPAADPSGHGQGRVLLGTIRVTTDASGNASFSFTTATPVPAGQVISATATDPGGDTSEFAQDVTVTVTAAAAPSQSLAVVSPLPTPLDLMAEDVIRWRRRPSRGL